MFNKGMFQQTSQSQTSGDEQFVQQGKKKPANLGKGLKMIPVFFLGLFLIFSLLQCVYSLEEDEYAVIRTWGYVQVEETPGIKFKLPYIQNVYKVRW